MCDPATDLALRSKELHSHSLISTLMPYNGDNLKPPGNVGLVFLPGKSEIKYKLVCLKLFLWSLWVNYTWVQIQLMTFYTTIFMVTGVCQIESKLKKCLSYCRLHRTLLLCHKKSGNLLHCAERTAMRTIENIDTLSHR